MEAQILHENLKPKDKREHSLILKKYNSEALSPPVPVYLPYNLSSKQFLELFSSEAENRPKSAYGFTALNDWFSRLIGNLKLQQNETHPHHKRPYLLKELDIEAADWFSPGKRLGFIKLQSKVERGDGPSDWVPGAVFLRGGSVAILIIVQPEGATGEDEKHVILTVQPRIAACSLAFIEIPAGMLDGDSNFTGKAAQEIKEEVGLDVKEKDLTNMTKLALSGVQTDDIFSSESLEKSMYPSPGACDEFIQLYLCQKRLSRKHMESLEGRATGLRNEGEQIKLNLVPLSRLWREAARDGKALAALSLYDNLKREGQIPEMSDKVEEEPEEVTGTKG